MLPPCFKTLNIYKETLENTKAPVASNIQENVTEIYATDMHTVSTNMLNTEQKAGHNVQTISITITPE